MIRWETDGSVRQMEATEDPLLQALSENGDDLEAALKSVARAEVCVVVTAGNIVGLNLDDSKITDAGLAKLEGLQHLRWIGLARSGVTEDGLNQFRAARPECNVLHT